MKMKSILKVSVFYTIFSSPVLFFVSPISAANTVNELNKEITTNEAKKSCSGQGEGTKCKITCDNGMTINTGNKTDAQASNACKELGSSIKVNDFGKPSKPVNGKAKANR